VDDLTVCIFCVEYIIQENWLTSPYVCTWRHCAAAVLYSLQGQNWPAEFLIAGLTSLDENTDCWQSPLRVLFEVTVDSHCWKSLLILTVDSHCWLQNPAENRCWSSLLTVTAALRVLLIVTVDTIHSHCWESQPTVTTDFRILLTIVVDLHCWQSLLTWESCW